MSNNNSESLSQQKNSSLPRNKGDYESPEISNWTQNIQKIKEIVQNTLK